MIEAKAFANCYVDKGNILFAYKLRCSLDCSTTPTVQYLLIQYMKRKVDHHIFFFPVLANFSA